ncbi:MAG: DNA alkylation repair protein [Ornithinibacter sp.]
MPEPPVEPVGRASGAAPDARVATAIRQALESAGDPERAAAQQAYLKSVMPHRGITSPEREAILRPILADPQLAPTGRGVWEATVRDLWDHATHREERYAAIALSGHRAARAWQDVDALELYRHLVVTGAWWDLVDPVAVDRVGPILLSHRAAATPMMRAWSEAGSFWLRRTAILAQLKHKDATDLGLLSHAIDSNLEGTAHGHEFFVRKAIGWALRQHARTDPEWVVRFVDARGSRLSGLSRREALKHL